jgi:hypothetical protein
MHFQISRNAHSKPLVNFEIGSRTFYCLLAPQSAAFLYLNRIKVFLDEVFLKPGAI